ncbi:hypothetical protein H9Q69_010360 [Fusarium xylarioides]|uniref:Uncharacterized protein n=1 Tax=Fusarium xylarioides TaxID=221167 RepID=A0A9P7HLW8_9HYPO|nr:hypothetical protein H9Q72_009215 [Fusarium xylarioides]KAG5790576.1 hypothetical protein H9Q69_010360 [Fusarium xylarioides]
MYGHLVPFPHLAEADSEVTRTKTPPAMSDQNQEDMKRITQALTDQKTIQQLSDSGLAAKRKREELERQRKAKQEAEEAEKKTSG